MLLLGHGEHSRWAWLFLRVGPTAHSVWTFTSVELGDTIDGLLKVLMTLHLFGWKDAGFRSVGRMET